MNTPIHSIEKKIKFFHELCVTVRACPSVQMDREAYRKLQRENPGLIAFNCGPFETTYKFDEGEGTWNEWDV